MSEKPLVAIIAQGGMGAACAKRLTDNGVRVLTSLAGRSEASARPTDRCCTTSAGS